MRKELPGKFVGAVLAVMALAWPTTASAQGFFEQLFGLAGPKQQAPKSLSGASGAPTTPGGRPYSPHSVFPQSRQTSGDDDGHNASKLKTVCVRMCDGYYFPISNSTTRKTLQRDQKSCNSACGEEARLFTQPAGSMGIDDATDNQGTPYRNLKTAFVYRKTQVAGCQCKQAPWSEAELNRHQKYADAEAAEKSKQKIVATATAAVPPEPKRDEKAAAPDAPVSTPAKVAANKTTPTRKTANLSGAPVRTAQSVPPRGGKPLSSVPSKPANGMPLPMALGAAKYQWPGDTRQN